MRLLLSIALFFLMSFHSLQGYGQGSNNACNTPEHRQFDFWVGDWNVLDANGTQLGTSKVELILNDCVIFENWTSNNPGYAGKSFNYYNPFTAKWNQKWIDTNGLPIEFEGSFDPEAQALIYSATTLNQNGQLVQNKLSFYKKSEDYVNQVWEQSTDAGNTWRVVFDGHYYRKSD
ncbi:hypothetical protein [Balneola vulgaris]|uniref:hypothetical protein n=1 Tax=Balneola vulgaris TaxID=287535 RepID=UPI00058C67A6|nr:hypothetical protein [Balneola vulgaris]